MGAPIGIFVGDTLEQLQEELAFAKERLRTGDRTSISGAGKSSSRSFSLTAKEHIQEVRYAIGLLSNGGRGPAKRTYFDVSRIP